MMLRLARTSALALCLVAPAFAQDAPPAVGVDTVLAEVNGQKITVGHMIAMRMKLPQEYQALPDEVLFNGLLDQMIQQSVLAAEVGTPSKAEALEIENQNTAMSAGIVIQRLLSQPVSEEALQALYTERYASKDQGTEYNASHILVASKEEADAIVAELRAGGDFAEIAKAKSTDPGSGANGGVLGWFGTGMMVKEFEDAVVAAKVGEVGDPVQSQFGWHVILVNETRIPAPPMLDEVRQELVDELRDKAVQDAIAAAEAKAQITRSETTGIDPAFLRNDDLLK
jgi:peptidyl-prolyl cis-trans isomerase C